MSIKTFTMILILFVDKIKADDKNNPVINFAIKGGKLYKIEVYCNKMAGKSEFKEQKENLLGKGKQKIPDETVRVELRNLDECKQNLIYMSVDSDRIMGNGKALYLDLSKISEIDHIIVDMWKKYDEATLDFQTNPGHFVTVFCYKRINEARTSGFGAFHNKQTMVVFGGETLEGNERSFNVLLTNASERHNCTEGNAFVDAYDSSREHGTIQFSPRKLTHFRETRENELISAEELFVNEMILETKKVMSTASLFKDAGKNERVIRRLKMIEVIANDRLGKKVRVKCMPDDTIGDLKKLIAAQIGTRADKIRLQKWYKVYNDELELQDYEIHEGFNFELYYN